MLFSCIFDQTNTALVSKRHCIHIFWHCLLKQEQFLRWWAVTRTFLKPVNVCSLDVVSGLCLSDGSDGQSLLAVSQSGLSLSLASLFSGTRGRRAEGKPCVQSQLDKCLINDRLRAQRSLDLYSSSCFCFFLGFACSSPLIPSRVSLCMTYQPFVCHVAACCLLFMALTNKPATFSTAVQNHEMIRMGEIMY